MGKREASRKTLAPSASEASRPGGKRREARRLSLQRAGHAVADRKQREVDSLVGPELGVERADRQRVGVVVGGIDDRVDRKSVV